MLEYNVVTDVKLDYLLSCDIVSNSCVPSNLPVIERLVIPRHTHFNKFHQINEVQCIVMKIEEWNITRR